MIHRLGSLSYSHSDSLVDYPPIHEVHWALVMLSFYLICHRLLVLIQLYVFFLISFEFVSAVYLSVRVGLRFKLSG